MKDKPAVGVMKQRLRVRFFKKIQDWILKSERIRKRIVCFFTQQINPRSFGSRCLKGAEESTPRVDSSVPLIHHDPRDLGLICLVKKRKIRFRILSDLRIQSWIFLKKRTLTRKIHGRRQTANITSNFLFFSCNPKLTNIKIENVFYYLPQIQIFSLYCTDR